MAKRGRFSGGSGYGGIPQQIINQIRLQAAGENTSNTGDTVKPNTEEVTSPEVSRARTQRMLTAEEIAADPVLSGRLSIDQAKINYLKAKSALNLMPGEGLTEKAYNAALKKANKAIAKSGVNPLSAERQFFALGGKMQGVGSSKGANYGWSEKKILDYWRSAGMEDKGLEIVSKIRGYDQYGNPVEGGPSANTVDYTLKRNDSTFILKSPVKGLSAVQAARLTKLKNIKQSGGTLTAEQKARLKRLKGMVQG